MVANDKVIGDHFEKISSICSKTFLKMIADHFDPVRSMLAKTSRKSLTIADRRSEIEFPKAVMQINLTPEKLCDRDVSNRCPNAQL